MKRMLALIALLAVSLAPLFAQEGGPPDMPPGGERGYERIRQLRKVRLVEMLELKEEQSVRFLARYTAHEDQRKQAMKDRGDIMEKIERLVRNKADKAEFEKAFAELMAIDDRMIADQRAHFKGLSDILTIEQQAKFLLFEHRFQKELREAMREAARRRRGNDPDAP